MEAVDYARLSYYLATRCDYFKFSLYMNVPAILNGGAVEDLLLKSTVTVQ